MNNLLTVCHKAHDSLRSHLFGLFYKWEHFKYKEKDSYLQFRIRENGQLFTVCFTKECKYEVLHTSTENSQKQIFWILIKSIV